jgi:tetratricopeptide (TPR) repeat protein
VADASDIDAYMALGRLYVRQQKIDEAIAQFDQVASRQRNAVAPETLIGLLLEGQGKREDAKARYRRALDMDPHAAVAANNLAWIYVDEGGNLDLALQLAQTAKAQLPKRPEVNDTLGWIYQKKGLSSTALPFLQDAVQQAPSNGSYRYHLAVAYAATSQVAQARDALTRALASGLSPADERDAKQLLATLPTP